MNKNQSAVMYIVLAIIFMVFTASVLLSGPSTTTSELTYSDFLQKLDKGEFKKVEIADTYLIAVPKEQPKAPETKAEDVPLSPFQIEKKTPTVQYKVMTLKDDKKTVRFR